MTHRRQGPGQEIGEGLRHHQQSLNQPPPPPQQPLQPQPPQQQQQPQSSVQPTTLAFTEALSIPVPFCLPFISLKPPLIIPLLHCFSPSISSLTTYNTHNIPLGYLSYQPFYYHLVNTGHLHHRSASRFDHSHRPESRQTTFPCQSHRSVSSSIEEGLFLPPSNFHILLLVLVVFSYPPGAITARTQTKSTSSRTNTHPFPLPFSYPSFSIHRSECHDS